MSGALLKLANSAVYGGRRKAKSIEQAILFLGINQVAALMTGLLARQAIPVNSAALANFWDLSTRRAHAMVFLTFDFVSYALVMEGTKPVQTGYRLKHPDAPY